MQPLSLIRNYFQPISYESMETQHPSTEDDRCRFRLAASRFKANRELDLCEDMYTMDEITEKRRTESETAVKNQTNARTRSKFGTLISHFDDLMAEINSRTEYQDKLDFLRGQILLLEEANLTVVEIWSLDKKEFKLNIQLCNIQQLLVAAREEIAELKMIEKEMSRSRHVVSVAVPVTIVAVATAITALKWCS